MRLAKTFLRRTRKRLKVMKEVTDYRSQRKAIKISEYRLKVGKVYYTRNVV